MFSRLSFLSTQFFFGKKEILRDYRFGFFLKKDTGQEGGIIIKRDVKKEKCNQNSSLCWKQIL